MHKDVEKVAAFMEEGYELPHADDLKPAEAARLYETMTAAKAAAERIATQMGKLKGQAKQTLIAVQETYELPGIDVAVEGGRTVHYSTYEFDAFTVVDPEAFKAWADTQDENYYDPTPKLREGLLRDKMRGLKKARQPLPPGVREYSEQRIQKTTKKGK